MTVTGENTYRKQMCNLLAFAIKSSHSGLVFWKEKRH